MAKFDGADIRRFELRVHDEPVLRLSVGLDLYFPRPMDDYREQVLEVWNRFLTWRGRDTLTWARLGGGNKSRKMNASAYRTVESWLRGSRSYGPTCFINAHDGEWEQIGRHAFIVYGNNRSPKRDDDTLINYVQVRLPLEVTDSPEELSRRLCELATPLQFECGTGGLMLHASPFSRGRLWAEMKGLVTRYEGVEPDMAEDGKHSAVFGLTGVNWLTFIGATQIDTLGGLSSVKSKASKASGVTARNVGSGVVLKAGPSPRIGDRNTPSEDIEPYKAVYKIVKPSLLFDTDYPFDEEDFDGDETVAWLQRFERSKTAS